MRAATVALAAIAVPMAGCSGSGNGGGSPTEPPPPTPAGLTFTISAAGVISPKSVTVSPGSRVTFVNNDNLVHEMYSDPHPEHTDCPELDQVGFLSPGQARQSGNLNTIRTCGFHDHGLPFDTNLQGSIIIH